MFDLAQIFCYDNINFATVRPPAFIPNSSAAPKQVFQMLILSNPILTIGRVRCRLETFEFEILALPYYSREYERSLSGYYT